jgi:outer membrane autotransporter protein
VLAGFAGLTALLASGKRRHSLSGASFGALAPALLILALTVLSSPANAACSIVYGTVVTSATVNMAPGDSCFAIQAGAGGVINAPGVRITGTPPANPPFPGFYVYAHDGGQINFSNSSVVDVTMGQAGTGAALTTRSALAADGPGSVIDARNGTTITVANQGHGIYMLNGGQVLIDHTTGINVNSSGFGIIVDNTTTTLSDNLAIDINGYNRTTFGNGLKVRNGGDVTIADTLTINGVSDPASGGVATNNLPGTTATAFGGIAGITVSLDANGSSNAMAGIVRIDDGASVDIKLSNATGQNVYGVLATGGGQLYGGHLDIEILNNMATSTACTNAADRLTCNAYGYGIRSADAGSFVDATNSTITLAAGTRNAVGAMMLNGGLVHMDSTTTITSVSNGTAPWDNIGIKIDRTAVPDGTIGPGMVLTMDGVSGIGLWATQASSATLGNVPSSISVDQFTVTGTGVRLGMVADAGSTITATNSSVTAHVYTGPLYNYAGFDSTPVAGALEVRGFPQSNAAGAPYLGGRIDFINSTATLLGATSAGTVGNDGLTADQTSGGILALYTDPTSPNVVNLVNSRVTTETAFGITALGSRVDINLSNGSQVSGGDCSTTQLIAAGGCRLVQANANTFGDPSFVNLTAMSGSIMTGDAFADADSTLNMSLFGNSLWTGAAHNVTSVTLDNSSTWVMTGNSTVSQTTTNAGLIQYTAPTDDPTLLASYKTLTTGNYVGQGGTIVLHTYLGADSSPSDRLIINGGAATGLSSLSITNTPGAGARTIGNGILIVDTINGGTTTPGAFALGNRAAAGAYDYLLFRGSVDASAPENWYLRSQLDCTLPGAAGMTECAGGGGGGGGVPIYRPEVIVDTAIPALASRFGLGMLGTWHERTGGEFATNYVTADGYRQAGWGRIFGATGSYGMGFGGNVGDRSAAFDKHGPSYNFTFGGLQAGLDLMRRENANGSRDIAGLYVGAGTARSDVRAVIDFGFGSNAGAMSMEGYSLGGYYTHIGPSGWYVDAVLQGTYYTNILATSNINESQTLRTRGGGLLASLESGYPIALGQGFTFEPQAQIVYQHLGFNDGADKFGRIGFSDSNTWYGRLSGRLSRDWTLENGRKIMAWARGGVWTDFGAQAKTTFSNLEGLNPTTLGTDLGRSWAQLDLGVSAQMSNNASVFAVGNYNVSVTGVDGHSFGGRAGVKVAW